MRLLIVRPEPGASATLARARALGLEAEARPVFVVRPLAWTVPDPANFDALLLTSANAVRHAGPGLAALASLPVHAVGAATAEAARGAGLVVSSVGSGDVAALLDSLPASLRLLHLAGADHVTPSAPQAITVIPVYHSAALDPAPALDDVGPAVLLVHSPRAGRRVAGLITDRDRFVIAAISAAAAAACGSGWRSVAVAAEPSDSALLSLAARLCQSSPPK